MAERWKTSRKLPKKRLRLGNSVRQTPNLRQLRYPCFHSNA